MAPALKSWSSDGPLAPEDVVRGYFHAKDENRPHLLRDVFAEDAQLEVTNAASTIAFPPAVQGREAIAEVLVRSFNRTYENIYTYALARPAPEARSFTCDWLVGMTEKDGGRVRVGCGRYEWRFEIAGRRLASGLRIVIEAMQVLPAERFAAVFTWLGALSYPWTSADEVMRHASADTALASVLRHLGRSGAGA